MEEAVAYQLVEPSRPGRSMRACCGGEAGVVVAAYSLLSFCIAGSALFYFYFFGARRPWSWSASQVPARCRS